MEIGQKLKNARTAVGLTQENVAEKLGVSRQTIYNWESNKYYPDIISVITLSDLYNISLDVLLKEDKKMIEHLEESTNVVKSNRRLSVTIMTVAYLVLWAAGIVIFWISTAMENKAITKPNFELMSGQEILAYYDEAEKLLYTSGILFLVFVAVFFCVLPVLSGIISFIVGRNEIRNRLKWLMVAFFGAMSVVVIFATIGLNTLIGYNTDFSTTLAPYDVGLALISSFWSAAGLLAALAVSSLSEKAEKKKPARS